MARVRDIELHEVPVEVQPVYERYAKEYGPFLNQVRVFAHRPPALKHIMGLLLDFAGEAILDKRSLEIALVTVSKLNECRYCVAHHAPRAVEHGIPVETVAMILDDSIPGFSETDMLVRDYAVAVTNKWNMIPESMFVKLRKQFSEEQIVELTLRIALCGFFNRFNDALQIEMENGVLEDLLSVGSKLEDLPD